jgi:hypothetical protein
MGLAVHASAIAKAATSDTEARWYFRHATGFEFPARYSALQGPIFGGEPLRIASPLAAMVIA